MKALFLIRHAKSSWDDTVLADRDRPLDDRGERDVAKMGKRLVARNVKADLIMSSPAKRALATAEVITKVLDYKRKDIVVNHRLYAGQVDDYRCELTPPRPYLGSHVPIDAWLSRSTTGGQEQIHKFFLNI